MNEQEYPQPEIKLPSNALAGDSDTYWVELGDHRFSKEQWELIQLYAEGLHRTKMMELDATGPASMQDMVRHFHEGMGQPVGVAPQPLPYDRIPVRVELIREEFIDELIPALGARVRYTPSGQFDSIDVQAGEQNVIEVVDACIDILYVTFGLLVEMGVNARPLFAEVQRSNMSKFGADGKAIIAGPNDPDGIFEGRVKKGPNYFKPNLRAILESGEADLG